MTKICEIKHFDICEYRISDLNEIFSPMHIFLRNYHGKKNALLEGRTDCAVCVLLTKLHFWRVELIWTSKSDFS